MENDVTEIDDTVKEYMKTLKGFKSLSKEEEHELLESYRKHNDVAARNKLITSNLKYACKLASGYRGRGIPFSELISEANDGLIHAIDEFDIERDVKLFSYAKWWIMQRMQDAIDKKNKYHMEDLPVDTESQTLNDDDVLIKECNRNEEFVDEIFNYEEPDTKKIITQLLDILGEREREIIKMYYGIGYSKSHNLEEVGEAFNLTKERIRQIIEKSFLKLRSEALLNCDCVYT